MATLKEMEEIAQNWGKDGEKKMCARCLRLWSLDPRQPATPQLTTHALCCLQGGTGEGVRSEGAFGRW